MTDASDGTVELLQRWHRGDRAALDSLLGRHMDALHRHVRAKFDRQFDDLRREQDSWDVVQQAAVRMLEYTPRFVPKNGAQFQALLRRFVLNDLLNQARSPRHARRDPTRDSFGDSVIELGVANTAPLAPDQALESAEQQALLRALAFMAQQFLADVDDRQVVLLHVVEEWKWEEIGHELGMSADAARMRYERLIPRLANHIRIIAEGRMDELLGQDEP